MNFIPLRVCIQSTSCQVNGLHSVNKISFCHSLCRVKIFYIPWIYPHFPDKFPAITGNYGAGG
jgi:hypothetical protein